MLTKLLNDYMTEILQYGNPSYNDEKLLNLIDFADAQLSETLLKVLKSYQSALKNDDKVSAIKYFSILHMYL